MEDNSGVKFLQAQVALARQWLAGDPLTQQKEVAVVIPQETKQGIVIQKPSEKDKEKEKVENIPIPTSEDEARNLIARFESGAPRGDSGVSDSVSSHVLRDKTSLLDESWYGTEQEELDS
jgi:phospholipase D1/2